MCGIFDPFRPVLSINTSPLVELEDSPSVEPLSEFEGKTDDDLSCDLRASLVLQ